MCRFWCRCVCLRKKREKKGGIVIRGKEEKSMIEKDATFMMMINTHNTNKYTIEFEILKKLEFQKIQKI